MVDNGEKAAAEGASSRIRLSCPPHELDALEGEECKDVQLHRIDAGGAGSSHQA